MSNIGRRIKSPSLSDVPHGVPEELRNLLQQIIYALDLREGRVAQGTNTRFVTIQDLVDAGVITDGEIK